MSVPFNRSGTGRTQSALTSLGQALDERRWLGFSIWGFALGSLGHRYGQVFVRRALLRHPRSVLHGLLAYRRFLAQENRWGQLALVGVADEDTMWTGAAASGPRLLVGVGFC